MDVDERFRPDPSLSRAEMEALQRELAREAVFADRFAFAPGEVCRSRDADQSTLAAADGADDPGRDADATPPVVAGIDQAFALDAEMAVSAVVAMRGEEVIERVHATAELSIPYVPGLLSFREGESVLRALAALDAAGVDPDLLVVDGSGRIHFRQAGLATHVGVAVDRPAVGVAKNLLCGTPRSSVEGLTEGDRVAIEADGDVDAPDGTVVGHAYQSRQYDSPNRHVNPLYVSPGHRVDAETAVDLVAACCAGYKLPEPTRLADAHADEVKRDL